GRLLDVGCGSGAYGASLLRLGWQVDGIEPDSAAAERARAAGVQVSAGDLFSSPLPAAAYDAITLWHVLEHLDDPVAGLRRLRPALKPGGLLLLETPNFAGLGARLTRSHWFHLDLPRHRVHFTPAGLAQALTLAGFHVRQLRHIPNPHGLAGAIAYRWGEQWRWQPAIQALGWSFGLLGAALHHGETLRAAAEPESGRQIGPPT
ncbi:MAG: class I SAM-dependent methyltransferase, partial [Caldilineales bacterium]|nr:class I SAM-dependent methyltransferase [Caldilineales bacterium]